MTVAEVVVSAPPPLQAASVAETAMPLKCQVGPGPSRRRMLSAYVHRRLPSRCVSSDALVFLKYLTVLLQV